YQVAADNATPLLHNPNGSDAHILSGDGITNTSGWVYYLPPPNACRNGAEFETFTYRAQDRFGLNSLTAVLPVFVTCVNDPPVATPETFVGYNDDPNTEVFLHVSDVENDGITICFTALPNRGRLYTATPFALIAPGQPCRASQRFIFQTDQPYEWG